MIPFLSPEVAPVPLKGATATPDAPLGEEIFDALFTALMQVNPGAGAVPLPYAAGLIDADIDASRLDAASVEPDDTLDFDVVAAEPTMPFQADRKLVSKMVKLPHADIVDVHIKLAELGAQPERALPTAELPEGVTVEAIPKLRAEGGIIDPPRRGPTIAQATVERQLGAPDIVRPPYGEPDRSPTVGTNVRALVESSTTQPATQGAVSRPTSPPGFAGEPKLADVVADRQATLPTLPKVPPVRKAAANSPLKGTEVPVLPESHEVAKRTDRAALPTGNDRDFGRTSDLISHLLASKPEKTDPALRPASVKEIVPVQAAALQLAVPAPQVIVASTTQSEKTGKFIVVSDPGVDATMPLGVGERVNIAPATAAPQTPDTADGARQVAQQIAVAINAQPGRAIEIALNPEELGRVRLSMTAVDATITLNVLAERLETTDLLRRYIDVLAQEFRDLGYEDITFSFGADAHADDGGSDERQSELVMPDDNSDGSAPTPSRSASGGLDLRI